MERADDLVSDQQTFGQVEAEVGAFTLDGVDFPTIVDDQDGVLRFGAY